MAKFARSWWGQKFIDALENITDAGRLSRGRSYASGGKVKSFEIEDGLIRAQVRGSVNPYFGVYKEPLYQTEIEIQPISAAKWAAAIAYIASKAGFISKLLLNEIPENIEEAFDTLGIHLLPRKRSDLKTHCSCPDYSNPCKHIAGVYYLVAAEIDRDPFVLFELRGLSKQSLQKELAKSPLGMALSAELTEQQTAPVSTESYYTQLETVPQKKPPSLREFWHGTKRLPTLSPPAQSAVPAILVKKQGDFPPFWHKDQSFIMVMEDLYQRVKTKNKDVL
jgi:uncharacterized Zn finger protein